MAIPRSLVVKLCLKLWEKTIKNKMSQKQQTTELRHNHLKIKQGFKH